MAQSYLQLLNQACKQVICRLAMTKFILVLLSQKNFTNVFAFVILVNQTVLTLLADEKTVLVTKFFLLSDLSQFVVKIQWKTISNFCENTITHYKGWSDNANLFSFFFA